MPTLIPLDDLLGVEFIGVILSTVSTSIIRVTVAATACSRDYTLVQCGNSALSYFSHRNLDHAFFAMRVYKLHPQRDTNSATAAPPRPKTHSLRPSSPAFTISGLSAGIACDSLIAASIIYYLQIRRTIFPRTNRAINLLITYALNTCLLTTVFTAITLALALNSRGNLREALDGRTVELVGLQSTTAMTSANSESTVRTPGGGAWGKQSSSAPAYYEMDIDGGQKDSTNV
ncbi:predicted protein [Postia placenta Mad-698-R]|nr:predicted protein [Postia placenta Mad-698-R]